jgi:hypothetical protein
VGSLALAAIGMLAVPAIASAACSPSAPCVMAIQVDGLTPTQVTQANTPFLWSLGHTSSTPPLSGRNGFTWQAPRAPMTAGLASSAASFLTGGYAEQTGIPGDDFIAADDGGDRLRLGSDFNADIQPITPAVIKGSTLFQLVHEQLGDSGNIKTTAGFVGDPDLGPMIAGDVGGDAGDENVDFAWFPTAADSQNPPQNPALCDIPRTPPGTDSQPPVCATSDEVTLEHAFSTLQNSGTANVRFTYIELAELGRTIRSGASADDVASTLHKTDAALAAFFAGYSSQACTPCSANWGGTIVMLNGTSGYESTPLQNRVPDPSPGADPSQDLANYVKNFPVSGAPTNAGFTLIPQGTTATVYAHDFGPTDSPAAPSAVHREALAQLVQQLEAVNNSSTCTGGSPPGCIDQVLYTRAELTPEGSADGTVKAAHPGWHFDHLNVKQDFTTGETSLEPSGRTGDLILTTKPGWAFGRSTLTPTEIAAGEGELSNPYPESDGGPRNRAVAAIINGFSGPTGVKALSGGWYPVADETHPEGNVDDPACTMPADTDTPDFMHLSAANATPEDDANADGHWCQAETLDFAPTIASLLKVALPADQICGRPLNEAFSQPLIPLSDQEQELDAYWTAGPVTPPDGAQYPQTDKNVTFSFNTSLPNVTRIDCGNEVTTKTTFECKLDGGDWNPCGSAIDASHDVSVDVGPLSKGLHEYCLRSVNPDPSGGIGLTGLPDPACAKFEVTDFFDFDGTIRDLHAHVADSGGHSYSQAPRGSRMDRIAISADYGRPMSAITLTLYKQTKGKKPCGITAFRPLDGASASSASTTARTSAGCPLKGLARFNPFKLDRGHVDLRLLLKTYRPTHVGVSVQEISPFEPDPVTAAACQRTGNFFCFYNKVGSADGGIVRILDAKRLYSVKGKHNKKHKKGKGK